MGEAIESPGEDIAQAQAALQEMTNGYWTTQILYALAQATHTHAPSLYRLMRALAGLGLFVENEDGAYETTILGRCLASGSPRALRARAILNGEDYYRGWGGLLHSVRT